MQKRRCIVTLLLTLACVSVFPAKCLEITLTSGTKIYYSFEKYIPLIRFFNGTMRVSTRKFEFSRIAQFAVIEEPDGISALESQPDLSADGNLLIVASLDPIQIFDVEGKPHSVPVTSSDEAQYVDLAPLSRGTYVVRLGEQSFTIYKK